MGTFSQDSDLQETILYWLDGSRHMDWARIIILSAAMNPIAVFLYAQVTALGRGFGLLSLCLELARKKIDEHDDGHVENTET